MQKKVLKPITRTTRKYIQDAIKDTKSDNSYKLCEHVANALEERHAGGNFDYQLERMGLETTGEIISAIDTYVYKYLTDEDIQNIKEGRELNQ